MERGPGSVGGGSPGKACGWAEGREPNRWPAFRSQCRMYSRKRREGLGKKSPKWGIPDPTAGEPRATLNIRRAPTRRKCWVPAPSLHVAGVGGGKDLGFGAFTTTSQGSDSSWGSMVCVNNALTHRLTAGHVSEANVCPTAQGGGSQRREDVARGSSSPFGGTFPARCQLALHLHSGTHRASRGPAKAGSRVLSLVC